MRWTRRALHSPATVYLLVAALGLLGVLPGLGERALTHSDEGYYVGTALEAGDDGRWLVPLQRGAFFAEYGKPPLAHLTILASSRLLGETKFAYRLPSALAAVLALVLLCALGEQLAPRAGLIAALLLLASPGWMLFSRKIFTENLVIACDLAGLWWYARARLRPHWRQTALAGLAFAGALLTKQLAGVFGLAAVVTAELFEGPRRWSPRRLLVIAGVAIAPLLLYLVYLEQATAAQGLTSMLHRNLLDRVLRGFPEQVRAVDDVSQALNRLLGPGTTLLGVLGVGSLLVARRAEPSARALVQATLAYLGWTWLIVAMLSRSFRTWYLVPAAYLLALAAGVLVARGLALLGGAWRLWPFAISGALSWALLQPTVDLEPKLLVSLGAAGLLIGAATLAVGLPGSRRLATARVAWLGALLLLLGGAVLDRLQHVSFTSRTDPVEAMVQTLGDGEIATIVAPDWYFKNEFRHYFRREGRLAERQGAAACELAPPGRRWAYLALERPARCWSKLKGKAYRAGMHWYFIGDPTPPPGATAAVVTPATPPVSPPGAP